MDNTPQWNAGEWAAQFRRASENRSYFDLHNLRSEVYENTVATVKAGRYTSCNGREVELPLNADIVEQTRGYAQEIHPEPAERYPHTLVRTVCEDCLLTAKRIRDLGEEVCVLNMANRHTPGGGVIEGCGAQEEQLFRRSDYFRSLYSLHSLGEWYGLPVKDRDFYSMDRNFGGVFTRGATVFRAGEGEGYPLLDEPWRANFIAVAGIDKPATEERDGETRLTERMVRRALNKMRTILRIAVDNRQPNLVLGALGCGAFHNPPGHTAELFRQVLAEDEFRGCFKRVFFSVIEDHNSRQGNFAPFAEALNPTAPDMVSSLRENEIFVFGSNLQGAHGGGAAAAAMRHYGAVWGQGVGLQGQSYAIPTMQGGPETIAPYVDAFADFAAQHPELRFLVTRIGCGIAGFSDEQIAPLFRKAAPLPNVCLPVAFQRLIGSDAFLN